MCSILATPKRVGGEDTRPDRVVVIVGIFSCRSKSFIGVDKSKGVVAGVAEEGFLGLRPLLALGTKTGSSNEGLQLSQW